MKKVICFHRPEEENGYLSNWYPSEFIWNNIKFTSGEQYMMYRKALLFNDNKISDEILNTYNVAEIKMLGRKVKNYNDVIWNGYRQIVMFEGLLEKFNQNDTLKTMLLETGDAILAEAAVKDLIWGIGLNMKDNKKYDLSKWRGQNLLGFTLMQVRDRLKKEAND